MSRGQRRLSRGRRGWWHKVLTPHEVNIYRVISWIRHDEVVESVIVVVCNFNSFHLISASRDVIPRVLPVPGVVAIWYQIVDYAEHFARDGYPGLALVPIGKGLRLTMDFYIID